MPREDLGFRAGFVEGRRVALVEQLGEQGGQFVRCLRGHGTDAREAFRDQPNGELLCRMARLRRAVVVGRRSGVNEW
ncbi:hypothetical protein GCM10010492_42870 [Saccharothrix mutabilis subsp. mutabilis]|uniref:Uncharacterized protein n=1 Tax=Saccharothrix mutabilis subsp. mutabilis TaxID=66855 RepID=A0ABN0U5A7_9PSEU